MELDRRNFLKMSSLFLGGLSGLKTAAAADWAAPEAFSGALLETPLRWLDGTTPESFQGTTWGVPWPQGQIQKDAGFALIGANSTQSIQSWPLAFWPDGSIKWSAHALPPDSIAHGPHFQLKPLPAAAAGPSLVKENAEAIHIDTGALQCTVPRTGAQLFSELKRQGREQARNGHLVLLVDDAADNEAAGATRTRYLSAIDTVVVEQSGPDRAVLKISGRHHHTSGSTLLPFVVRLYFYRGSDNLRLVHSLVYDADPVQAFIRGVGLRFDAPLDALLHDRHVRFVSDEGGVFAEAVRGLTGLRRNPGASATAAQLAGAATPPVSDLAPAVAKGLPFIPAFGDYSLLQGSADGFSIKKRTTPGHGWIHAASGTRASGTGYLGSPKGGIAFGIRNFWQSYPGQIDISGADSDQARITLWLWAPQAPGMDLRFYHDGLGQNDFASQLKGLDISYEDYEPGFGTPYGIARTSEIELQLTPATPSAAELVRIARRIQSPPQLLPTTTRLYQAQAFNDFWRPAEALTTPAALKLSGQLQWVFDYYRAQVAQHKWYGFWDYGDVMHTYDADRHVWRYDVGGFAWDNSELSTEIWLWHYFLYSGKAEAYRMAEAMTRHTSEVDIHHIGPFSPLGSRHNVQHWGDSAKQLRVSTVVNRRFFYYLSADERLGDLLREQVNAVERLRQVLPGRKVGQKYPETDRERHASLGFGTDWGAVAAAWFTEWERSGQPHYRDKLIASMASIAAQPHGFFTGGGVMDLQTGAFALDQTGEIAVSHLSAVFGLTEICSELIRSIDLPAFRAAWLQYCTLYNASAAEQAAALGKNLGSLNLGQGHARLLGFAGAQTRNKTLQEKAWVQFFKGNAGITAADLRTQHVSIPQVLHSLDEAPTLSTNAVAQWGLGAIGLLAVAPNELPERQ